MKKRLKRLAGCVQACWRWVRHHAATITLVLGLAAIGFIACGLWHDRQICETCQDARTYEKVSTVVYETARVLSLNMDAHSGSNLSLTIGRVLAVLFVGFLGLQALLLLLKDSALKLKLLLWKLVGGHTIVCGLGRVGLPLVRQLCAEGKWVLVIEKDAANPHIKDVQRLGALVIVGDATDDTVLAAAHVRQAAGVMIATGDDTANIEVAVDVQAALAGAMPADFRGQVHIVDPALAEVLATRLAAAAGHDRMRTFNAAQFTARNLIVRDLATVRPTRSDQVALYVLFGCGSLGRTLLRHLAELAHFENQKRSRILILCDDPPRSADEFLAWFGRFAPECVVPTWTAIRFDPASDDWGSQTRRPRPEYRAASAVAVEYAANAVFAPLPKSMNDLGFLTELDRVANEPGVKPAVILCHEEDDRNYSDALLLDANLRRHFQRPLPLFLWLQRQEALHTMLATTPGLTAFGLTRRELTLDQLRDPQEDRIGRLIQAGYEGADYSMPQGKVAIDAKWNSMEESFRHSNRMAAVHFEIKLACLGLRLAKADEPGAAQMLTPDQAETLARMEHNRWMAERLLAGTAHGPRSVSPPQRPQLCTWDELLKDPALRKEPEKDFQQLQAIINKLPCIGLKIV